MAKNTTVPGATSLNQLVSMVVGGAAVGVKERKKELHPWAMGVTSTRLHRHILPDCQASTACAARSLAKAAAHQYCWPGKATLYNVMSPATPLSYAGNGVRQSVRSRSHDGGRVPSVGQATHEGWLRRRRLVRPSHHSGGTSHIIEWHGWCDECDADLNNPTDMLTAAGLARPNLRSAILAIKP